jgi:hypothetical protein
MTADVDGGSKRPARMSTHGIIRLEEEQGWRCALRGVPHAVAHTWEHCRAMHLSSGLETFLFHFAGADARVVCAFAERKYQGTTDICTPSGFSGFVGNGCNPESLECWNRLMGEREYVCGYVALHPTLSDPSWFDRELHQYATAYSLDLTLSQAEVYRKMSEGQRRVLKQADVEDVQVWTGTSEVKQFFARSFHEAHRRRNAGELCRLSTATLEFFTTMDNILFIGAGRGEVESVTAIGFTPYSADALYNVSFAPDTSFSTVLLWRAIREFQARGVPALNLGVGFSRNDGLSQYKRSLGATERPLYCLKQVYDRAAFAKMCEQSGVNDADPTGYFPPHRVGTRIT